ncbi:MAG: phage late control D family protein [Lachnospiraceae bacterium]|nr:phage late control D family protein [Lachnospiraceae bacterium]
MKNYYDVYGDGICIKTTIPAARIVRLQIDIKESEHVKGVIEAEISEHCHQEAVNSAFGGDKITVLGKENRILFGGLVEKVEFEIVNKFIRVFIYCVSSTIRMDRDKRERCFQNPQLTYTEVLNEVMEKYENATYYWNIRRDHDISYPLLQYHETDWEFVKRLATHFHTVIYSDYHHETVSFHVGCKKGEMKGEISHKQGACMKYGISDKYYTEGGFEDNKDRAGFAYIEISLSEELDISDNVRYQGRQYVVYRKQIVFERGELTYNYLLGTDFFTYRKKGINRFLAGFRTKGEIKRAEAEKVYMKLDMEDKHAAQYPWPWVPETGNLCYCMPEQGTDAILYFPSGDERDGIIIHALHKNRESSAFSDVQNRKIHTLYDKKIGLCREKLMVEGKEVSIYLEDANGIRLKSKYNIKMNASQGIYVEGKKGAIIAPLEIVCKTNRSNIEINRDFNFYAPEGVQTYSKENNDGPVYPENPGREMPGHWQMSFAAMASVPKVDFSKADGDGVIDLMAEGSVPRIAGGGATVAMADVMSGKPESEVRHKKALRSMEIYTVKGGYATPETEDIIIY